MKSARQSAFEILEKIQRDNSYSNLTLDTFLNNSDFDRQDKAFVTALVYGVTERLITLDYNISALLTQPIKKLKPQVLIALRMGAYQILFMDKIPVSAAVNESVKLVKNNQCAFASGLVNAILHKIVKYGLKLPNENEKNYFSVKYSCPEWICELWKKSYGADNAEKLLSASLGNVKTALRVNTLKCSADELINLLENESVTALKCKGVNDALIVENGGALQKNKSFAEGLFHIQDISSQLCCKALDADENDIVFDICSAPGGKSFTLGEMMKNKGKIYSFDIYEQRLKLINDSAERLGITNIVTEVNDGTVYNNKLSVADKILCDVPCSGLGVIRKKPEIRYKKLTEVDKLPDLQYSILRISSKYLKVGGTMIYSTCSLNPDENENVVNRFLSENPNFVSVKVFPELQRYNGDTDYISLMPHIHNCDGFFISKLKKIG